MTTQQQRKAKARARHEAYVERQHAKAERRRKRNVTLAAVAGIALVVAGVGYLWWSSSDDPETTAGDSPSDTDLTYPAADQVLPEGTPADLVLDTDRGPITIALDTTKAPKNANSLAFLAAEGYFDGTTCHRLTTEGIFVLQCGDRTGTGAGNPGYTTGDENLPKADNTGIATYPQGAVAMAEPQGGEAGSQFFLVYKDSPLPPDYTIVGTISDGLEIVEEVAAAGVAADSPNPADGPPAEPITITAARVDQESP